MREIRQHGSEGGEREQSVLLFPTPIGLQVESLKVINLEVFDSLYCGAWNSPQPIEKLLTFLVTCLFLYRSCLRSSLVRVGWPSR